MLTNPCLSCGACCACYRASFYWAQTDDVLPGGVPKALTEDLPPRFRVMKGTNDDPPYCIALQGSIGERVHCSIYPVRADVCRDFPPSFEKGVKNERCDKARARWGLRPLEPGDWEEPLRPIIGIPLPEDGDPDTLHPLPKKPRRVA